MRLANGIIIDKEKTFGVLKFSALRREVRIKEFDYNAEVEIINPAADTVATATFQGADVDWYIKADNIVLKNKTVNQQEIRRTITSKGRKEIRKSEKHCLYDNILIKLR